MNITHTHTNTDGTSSGSNNKNKSIMMYNDIIMEFWKWKKNRIRFISFAKQNYILHHHDHGTRTKKNSYQITYTHTDTYIYRRIFVFTFWLNSSIVGKTNGNSFYFFLFTFSSSHFKNGWMNLTFELKNFKQIEKKNNWKAVYLR